VKRLRVAPEAEEELAAAAEWYEARRAGLGVELVASIDGALEEILAAPLSCAAWRPDRPYRKKVVRRFPYVIFFTLEDETVVVVAIAHTRRRPGYWARRTTG
jgi:plasmid stabilization system protein ParE